MATTLESLVSRYRRAVAPQSPGAEPATVELEIRFQSVDFNNFEAIYNALLAKKIPVEDGTIEHSVNSIMEERVSRAPRTTDATHHSSRPQRLRQLAFENGAKVSDKFTVKSSLMPPFRVANPFALAYNVALSTEAESSAQFSADEGATIRVKARAKFPYRIASATDEKIFLWWTVDMTVVRQISGSAADSSLKHIVDSMFRTKARMTASNMFQLLHLEDPNARQLFRFEMEVEFLGAESPEQDAKKWSPAAAKDILRPADVTAVAAALLHLSNPAYLRDAAFQAEVYHIATFIVSAPGFLQRFKHELSLKRLLPQVTSLTRADYRAIYPPVGFWVTDKADGIRAVASVLDWRVRVLAGDALYEFEAPAGARDKSDKKARMTAPTIVDAELIYDDKKGTTERPFTLWLFDVIAVAGENVSPDGIEKRITHRAAAASILKEFGLSVKLKPYVHLDSADPKSLEAHFASLLNVKDRPYEIDGLIPSEPGKGYLDTVSYKWKPAEHWTIDFLARRCPLGVLGKEPFADRKGHKLYFLFVGITPDMMDALGLQWCPGYADLFGAPEARRSARRAANTGSYLPIQFSPSGAPLAYLYQHPDESKFGDIDMKVVELLCGGDCAAASSGAALADWKMVKLRQDRMKDLQTKRYYGNDFRTAELTWLNYLDPFPVSQLWTGPSLDYFVAPKSGIYRAQTGFISFIKSQRILTLRHSACVVDLGFGKGQDLGRYIDAEVRALIAVDKDRAALNEAVRRKYDHAQRKKKGQERTDAEEVGVDERLQRRVTRQPHKGTILHIVVADLLNPFAGTLAALRRAGLPEGGADAVVNNLAVHYMMGSVEGMRNFVALCRECVKVDGHVNITAMTGIKVHTLFTEAKIGEGQSWDVRQDGALKYSLKRMYGSATLQAAGQKIGVLLPFSNGNYYEEYLVNTTALTNEFVARGFRLVSIAPVQKQFEEFKMRNAPLYKELTDDDKTYLSLYGEIILQRIK